MANDAQPYGIGSEIWPGLAKLMEEMGELQQVLGKIMACSGPNAIYWDGNSLKPHLIEELADVDAALHFFVMSNLEGPEIAAWQARAKEKHEKFCYWDAQHRNTDGS